MTFLRLPAISAFKYIVLLCSVAIALPVYASTPEKLSAKIANHREHLQKNKNDLVTISARLDSYRQKETDAIKKVKEAEEYLANAKKQFEDSYKDPTADTILLREQYQKRKILAQTGLLAKEARLERIERKILELGTAEKQKRGAITWLESQLVILNQSMRRAINNKTDQQITSTSSPNPRKEEKVTTIIPAKGAAPLSRAETHREIRQSVFTQTNNVVSHSEELEAINLSPMQKYAYQQMNTLRQRIKGADRTDKRGSLELVLEVDNQHVIELEYLGNDQFYTEVELLSGKHTLAINLRKYVATVPGSDKQSTYVVIYDGSNPKDGKLIIFDKKLIL